MSKKSKTLTIIIIFLVALGIGLFYSKGNITSFLTDSGFDSSYGGGGGYSGGGGSSYGGSSHSSSGGSSYDGSFGTFEAFIIVIVVVVILILSSTSKNSDTQQNAPSLKLNKNKAWDQEKFASVVSGITLDKFLFERTADLVQIQYNWMNFDYKKLREKVTDELYNQYEMQLKTLSMKGQKNIMKEFNPIESIVTNVTEDNGKYTVTMELVISFIDYIEENNKVVRGNSSTPITMHYELVFTSSSNGFIDECPQCGSKLDDTTTQVCPYCRSQITQNSTKWVLSKKIAKGQR